MTQIHVVGIGLDGKVGLTSTLQTLISQANLLVGSDRHLSYFHDHCAPKLILDNLSTTIKQLRQCLPEYESILILVSGDPLFFGLGRLLLTEFPPEILTFHPHVSSVQLAFSRVKVPWQDAKIISVHGRSTDELISALQKGTDKIALLTDNCNTPAAIARLYLSLDLPSNYQFWVCENLGSAEEKVNSFSAEDLQSKSFSPLNVVIILRQNQTTEQLDISKLPLLGLPDSTFLSFPDRPGLMTKKEVRQAILGELSLQDQQTVWDVGAGTGSVSIEIARLCPNSQVYAVEKMAMGVSLIEKNCHRLQVSNIKIIQGKAPEVLLPLPKPNRIFIGGSGGNLQEILTVCQEKIAPDGVLVLAFATLEHLHTCLEWLRSHNWNYHVGQWQISRSVSIGNLSRFSPLNPVTIIRASFFAK